MGQKFRLSSITLLGFTFFNSSELLAQAAAPAGGSGLTNLIGIALMFGVFFFLIILPQSRKAKKHAQFIAQLKKGDAVVTQSGLYGKIHGIADKVITLEVAPKIFVRVDRQTIAGKDPFTPSSEQQVIEGGAA